MPRAAINGRRRAVRHRCGDVPVLFLLVRERVPLSTMGKFTLREHLAGCETTTNYC